mmetsp:Transcript_3559/g.4010  ORF Transcript_3559/g.4010 Transcript_3559/m.4010 type:complete len:130 (+) Transcript_3559:69-458(+)
MSTRPPAFNPAYTAKIENDGSGGGHYNAFNPQLTAKTENGTSDAGYDNGNNGSASEAYTPGCTAQVEESGDGARNSYTERASLSWEKSRQKIKQIDKKYHITRKTKSAASTATTKFKEGISSLMKKLKS